MESGFYMTTVNDQLSGWTKNKLQCTSQGQTNTMKGHGHCLVVCCLSDPLQLSEDCWNHYIWEVCSANRWDAPKIATLAADIGQEKTQFSTTILNLISHNQHFKSLMNWATEVFLILHVHITSCQLTSISLSMLTTFWGENTSTTSKRHKMINKNSLNPKAWIFSLQK